MTPPPRRWILPPRTEGHRLPADLPLPVVQLLLARGIADTAALDKFLNPPGVPHDPLLLAGVPEALPRLAAAAQKGETVAVFGDFDVDGITGTAILTETLGKLGARVIPYLPHPVAEGHGMTAGAVERLIAQGASLIVTVDCGISNADEVALAADAGAEVIITDHHVPPERRPPAVATVNPRVAGNRYPFVELCGAGIAYKLAAGLLDYAGAAPDDSLLELAALGTVADLVPLRGENRHIVQRGLAALSETRRPGLQALLNRCRLRRRAIRAEDVAFQIAPRLNAAGRMAHPETALQLLLTNDPDEAESLAGQLEDYNNRRKDLSTRACAVAMEQVAAAGPLPSIIISFDGIYTPGINGLVAGRLAERFNRPAVALARADDGHLVASARSRTGFSLIAAITECDDLLVRYGGHDAAAGFTVRNADFNAVSERLHAIADAETGLFGPEPTLEVHAEGRPETLLDPLTAQWIQRLEPYGKDNPTPRFLSRRARVLNWEYVGREQQHLKLQISAGNGSGAVDALYWNHPGEWGGYSAVDLVFQLVNDRYRGENRTYLRIDDWRPAG